MLFLHVYLTTLPQEPKKAYLLAKHDLYFLKKKPIFLIVYYVSTRFVFNYMLWFQNIYIYSTVFINSVKIKTFEILISNLFLLQI